KDIAKNGAKKLKVQSYLADWQRHFSAWTDASWDPIAEAERNTNNPTASDYLQPVAGLKALFLQPNSFDPEPHPDLILLQETTTLQLALVEILAAFYAFYQQTLQQQNACDFDDLINHAVTLLENNPALRANYQNQFETLIVDEFQDSNASQ